MHCAPALPPTAPAPHRSTPPAALLPLQAAEDLADMRSLVEQQLQSLRRLSQAKGALDHLTRGAGSGRGANLPAPHAAAAAQYTLEWLDLRVA